jgi:DNA repair protein SbcD/Mre11
MILKDRLRVHFLDLSTLHRGPEGVLRIPSAAGEQIVIGAVPFVRHANAVRSFIDLGTGRSTLEYADFVGNIEARVGDWLNDGYDPRKDIRIFAAHLLVAEAVPSQSEYKFHLESDFSTRAQRIPVADYVAFGHIHKPQVIPGVPHGRYAGAPVPIDFGERDDVKCVYVVAGRPGRSLEITQHNLDVGRKMVEIGGTLESISSRRDEWTGAIARVVVDVDAPLADLESRIRGFLSNTHVVSVAPRYPHAVGFEVSAAAPAEATQTLSELFVAYLKTRSDMGDADRVTQYFQALLDGVARDEGSTSLSELDEILA